MSSCVWVKAFHIVFVSSWFAGRLHLPRWLVNQALLSVDSHASPCRSPERGLKPSRNRHSHPRCSLFNEVTVLLRTATAVLLVVVKPF